MAERKPISKKTRFEVFKRDKFTCQYCGRMAPDVILEIDHIKPVAKGGTNNVLNLITSCRDCNRGKGKRPLSDNAVIKLQQEQLLDLADKAEQLQMMVDWKNELLDSIKKQVQSIDELIFCLSAKKINDDLIRKYVKYFNEFPFNVVWDATIAAFEHYYDPYKDRSFIETINKVGGICYNMMKRRRKTNGNVPGDSNVILDGYESS